MTIELNGERIEIEQGSPVAAAIERNVTATNSLLARARTELRAHYPEAPT